MKKANIASAALAATALASLGTHAAAFEGGAILGRYDCQLKRAEPGFESEHVRLVKHLDDLTQQYRSLERAGDTRPETMVRLRTLLAEMDQIEAYLAERAEVEKELYAPNVVTDVGARFLLDNGLAGSAYTAAFFLGLIGAVSYTTGPAAADTMASHGGWTESGGANAPAYSGARKTAAWAAATGRSKSLSAALTFTFTSGGTAKGPFLTTVSTVDGTTGTLFSAGLFSGGDQPVVNTNTLSVSYTSTLT